MDASGRERYAHAIRRTVIEQSHRAGVGHIGSALSIADLVAAVLAGPARVEGGADRDRIVLSKGHAALALYAALDLDGRLEEGAIDTYCANGTLLGVHPEHGLDGVDFCTGSLGQGLSLGAGAALAAKRQGSERHVYVIMSDAELNEGSVWEATMFAALHPVGEKLEAFGWSVQTVPGHDQETLGTALAQAADGRPRAIVAQTTFGYGVSFMESEIKWHYLPLDDESLDKALAELDARAAA